MTANLSEPSLDKIHRDFLAYQRHEMLGSLSGIIAHEYNNLMTPVLMRAQDALSRSDTAAMNKALSVTMRQTTMALEFTREVIQMAQGSDPEPCVCEADELVRSSLTAAVRPLNKDAIELTVDVAKGLKIMARPRLFVQAMLNLLLNSRRAMKEHRGGRMSITAKQSGEYVVFAVRDSGTGIPQEVLENEVIPFFNEEPGGIQQEYSSVGLGMQACRMIAWEHGATISVRNNEGPGCTFFLKWPAA